MDENENSAELSISQLQEDVKSLEDEKIKLMENKRDLEDKNKELHEQNKELLTQNSQLEVGTAQAAILNHHLNVQNQHLLVLLNHSASTLQALRFGVSNIANDDKKTCFYTGLPTYDVFFALYNLLKPYHNGVPNIDHFYGSLVYLRLHTPVSFGTRAATYSNYKKHNTVKVFIAIAPTGAITFISKAWTGRVSDKVITQRCGFLDKLEYGDVVLADRGFNIHDDMAVIGAKLEIPAFTKGKSQLSRAEVEKSRRLARVRIHVERVIGQLRKKYKILQHTLPITLIKRPSDVGVATIDKILFVTAALTNLSQTVI